MSQMCQMFVCSESDQRGGGGAGDTITLHNEGIHDLYSLPNVINFFIITYLFGATAPSGPGPPHSRGF